MPSKAKKLRLKRRNAGILADTSVLIKLYRRRLLDAYFFNISIITVLEFVRGAKTQREAVQFLKLLQNLYNIEPIDDHITLVYWEAFRQVRKSIEDNDLLIGATALAKNYTLWTANEKHFKPLKKLGLKIKAWKD